MVKEKIEEFIKEILDKERFNICHELYGHCLAEHLLELPELQTKLWDMPKATDRNPIVAATRFFSEECARSMICETLLENIDDIVQWRKNLYTNILTIEKEFENLTGEGIIKNADWNRLIPMHKLIIVLANGDSIGQPFYIKTAYPSRSFDDNDACYDAIDEFQAKKRRRRK